MENTTKPTVHTLKTIPPFFEMVKDRKKRYEIRKNDRAFKQGDYLVLQEFIPKGKIITGRQVVVKIDTFLQEEVKFALKQDFCVMGIKFKEELSDEERLNELGKIMEDLC